ncbi:transcriptional regulator [Syntrophotalea acetylenivorans]|uniref:Transcriptional regulator n=1 Tax=Syntrophotalea acetylenivorans TaxID=1842532 RepID=A0A1L3GLG3_9BACT|nr:transcriptional regulator [Syntrophotalea acetylenivorans]APG26786.1 transcriptional regulator [Syntrophotalea acetylenivorans]
MADKQALRPPVPVERAATLRQQIVAVLQQRSVSAKDLSMEIGMPEKQVYDHLEHIRRSFKKQGKSLRIEPARCKKCGFIFEKRQRFHKPGKCPACRGQAIEEPRFSLLGSD